MLHVGAPKTGTTSIQHWLVNNRAALRAQGFYIPATGLSGFQHITLPATFGRRRANLERHADSGGVDVAARREALPRALANELSRIADCHTLLVFSEYMFPADDDEIAAYRRLFAPHAARFESLLYLRRQDAWLASRALQARKTGSADLVGLNVGSPRRYTAAIHAWDAGSDDCRIRRFDTEFLVNGCLFTDFADAIGARGDSLAPEPVHNLSVRQEQLELVDALNSALTLRFPQQIGYRSAFVALCHAVLGGARFEFPRASAEAAFSAYAPINSWLRETRDPLGPRWFFNDDFSRHPERAVNDRRYTMAQLSDLLDVIAARRTEHQLTTARGGGDRIALIGAIVHAFIGLHGATIEQDRAVQRAARSRSGGAVD